MSTAQQAAGNRKQDRWAVGLASVLLAATLGGPATAGPIGGVKQIVDLDRTPYIAALPYTLTAHSLDFGPTAVGTQKVLDLGIDNKSDAALYIVDIRCEGSGFDAWPYLVEYPLLPLGIVVPGAKPVMMVHPGRYNSFRVRFSPSSRGVRTGRLSFTVSTWGNKEYAVSVPLTGSGAAAQSQMNVSRLDFGDQAIFTQSEPRAVTLVNTGSVAGEYQVRRQGRINHFNVDLKDKITLAAGGSSSFKVRFAPQFPGFQTASLVFEEVRSGELLTLPLTGAGIDASGQPVADVAAPEVEVSRRLVDFGTPAPGIGASEQLTITNRGDAVVTISALQLSGLDRSEFSLTVGQNLPWVLMPQELRTVLLRFQPVGLGTRSAALLILHDGAEGSALVSLTGTGGMTAAPPPGPPPVEQAHAEPPVEQPIEEQPVEEQPATEPPVGDPPAEDPPAADPPAEEPAPEEG